MPFRAWNGPTKSTSWIGGVPTSKSGAGRDSRLAGGGRHCPRRWYAKGVDSRDLEVTGVRLEEAFIALTRVGRRPQKWVAR